MSETEISPEAGGELQDLAALINYHHGQVQEAFLRSIRSAFDMPGLPLAPKTLNDLSEICSPFVEEPWEGESDAGFTYQRIRDVFFGSLEAAMPAVRYIVGGRYSADQMNEILRAALADPKGSSRLEWAIADFGRIGLSPEDQRLLAVFRIRVDR